jgi:hypothetical protein
MIKHIVNSILRFSYPYLGKNGNGLRAEGKFLQQTNTELKGVDPDSRLNWISGQGCAVCRHAKKENLSETVAHMSCQIK